SRLSSIISKGLVPYIPKPNVPGAGIQNNYSLNQGTFYNLHKIDTKFDYVATSKLRVSARYGYQPFNSQQDPIFGPILGGSSGSWPAFSTAGAGNYQQHGATLAVSASATYVASPSLVIDATFGLTQAHQILSPVQANVKYGSDVLGIPGSNQGTLPLAGGMPNFGIAQYGGNTTYGYSYPPLEYKDPVFEYVANVTKTVGSHNIRFGEDTIRIHENHNEIRNTIFAFSGGLTSTPGGASPNPYNGVADFLLGAPQNTTTWVQFVPLLTLREWQFGVYVRDQWQARRNLTINYGLRWEHYPVATRADRGIEYNNLLTDLNNPTMEICGVGGNPGDCGIKVSNKLFSPGIGISYRPTTNIVVRSGFALSPIQYGMANSLVQNYPAEQQYSNAGDTAYVGATTVGQGFPTLVPPVIPTNGNLPIPVGTANANTTDKNFIRGYVESWNLMVENELGAGFVGQIGYVGTHVVNGDGTYNFNYGTPGGGAASQRLNLYGMRGSTNVSRATYYDEYNGLQAQLTRRLTNGFSMKLAYTWSKDIWGGFPGGNQILVPQYRNLNRSLTSVDRTNNFIVTATYMSPFGKNKSFVTGGVGAFILGGWSLNGTFNHLSGTPFSITADATSCNCPGNSQRANQILPTVRKVGRGVFGTQYFDTNAFAPVTTAQFGTASFNSLRGPGYTNLDASITRDFHIWERVYFNLKLESYNVTNTPHFGNPAANVSNTSRSGGVVTALNGFGSITSTAPLGRQLDQRYFRLGGRLTF
ncbi:MAG: TonB-dependent receptor, partial [Granulicella sp.]